MALKIKPSLSRSILNTTIHWFKKSNTYLILGPKTDQLFDLFLHSKDIYSFQSELANDSSLNLDETAIESITSQMADLNHQLNNPKKENFDGVEVSISRLSKYHFTKFYRYNTSFFKINYGSKKIAQVFHPQWTHLEVPKIKPNDNSFVEFSIENYKNQLALFRNNDLVVCYHQKDFHYLQGKLGLELINHFYSTKEEDWLGTFHASAIEDGSSSILLVGVSGSGKSTLTAILATNGYHVLADDVAPMLASTKEIYRFPNAISIKEGAFEALETIVPKFSKIPVIKSISKNVESRYVAPDTHHSNKRSYTCNTLLLVNYNANGPNQLHRVNPEKILKEMIPDSWINPSLECAEIFLDWLSSLNYFEMCYNNNDFAIEAVDQLFANNQPSH